MVDLPIEIWLHIADFIGYPEITKYLAAHRAFLEYALDQKYREVGFYQSRAVDMFSEAERLKRPGITPRVRVMKLWPHSIVEALNGASLNPPWRSPSTTPTPPGHDKSLLRRFFDRLFRRTPNLPAITPVTSNAPSIPDGFDARFAELTMFIERLTGITELHICWLSTFHASSMPDFQSRFKAFLPPMSANLRILILDIAFSTSAVDSLASLSSASLQELSITTRALDRLPAQVNAKQRDALVAFINNFVGTLRHLSLFINVYMNTSPIFDNLQTFTRLRSLSLALSFNPKELTNPSSIGRFLSRHRNLYSLRLAERHCGYLDRDPAARQGYRFHECFSDLSLPHLTELSLGLPISEGLRHDVQAQRKVQSLLGNLCSSVSVFRLEGIQLSNSQAIELLRALPCVQLTSLSLHVGTFKPSLLQSLVTKCRRLEHLKLDVEYFEGQVDYETPWEQETFLKGVDNLGQRADFARYCETWTLRDLDIMTWEYGKGRRQASEVIEEIAKLVPSIRWRRRAHTPPSDVVVQVVGFCG